MISCVDAWYDFLIKFAVIKLRHLVQPDKYSTQVDNLHIRFNDLFRFFSHSIFDQT